MKVAYFDCIAGSGDMILGALVDAGLPEQTLISKLSLLPINEFEINVSHVKKNAFSATKVDVIVSDDVPERHLHHIKKIVDESKVSPKIKDQSIQIFQRLCEVEAGIHGSSPDKVHLHELGGVDTIVDVIGTLSGLEALGIERVYSSPLPMGRGFIKGAHGQIPLPAPATIALLEGIPVIGSEIEAELVTPTGAVLLASLAKQFGALPAMTIESVGYGAGSRDLPIPNVLRLLVGEQDTTNHIITEDLMLLETNIDDQNPEIFDYVMARLFEAGALDVFLIPIQMKKNRPATMIHVLCAQDESQKVEQILFSETIIFGIRKRTITRSCLPRTFQRIKTKYGEIQIKISTLGNGQKKFTPEYEDCRRLAEKLSIPLREIFFAAEESAKANL